MKQCLLLIFTSTLLLSLSCSSFKSKESDRRTGSGDAQEDSDGQGSRTDPIMTGARGNEAAGDEDGDQSIIFTANGQRDILSVDGQTPVVLNWEAKGYEVCELEGTAESGLVGTHEAGVVSVDAKFTLICNLGETSDSKTIKVKIEPGTFEGPVVALSGRKKGDANFVGNELTVPYGSAVDLRASSVRASTAIYACSLQPLGVTVAPEDELTLPLQNQTQTTIFSFSCEDYDGLISTATFKLTVLPAKKIQGSLLVNGKAGSTVVGRGDIVAVKWQASNATSCTVSVRDSDPLKVLSQGNGAAITSFNLPINTLTILDLNCAGNAGAFYETSAAIHVQEDTKGAANLTARVKNGSAYVEGPLKIGYGDDVEIKWTSCVDDMTGSCQVSDAAECKVVTPFHGEFPKTSVEDSSQGTAVLAGVKKTQSLLLTCVLPDGVAYDFLTVEVGLPNPPAVNLLANGKVKPTDPNAIYTLNVNYGDDVALDWTSKNASSCEMLPAGFSGLSGHFVIKNFTQTTVVSVTCEGPGGVGGDAVVIRVGPNTDGPDSCQSEGCWHRKVSEACDVDSGKRLSKTFTVLMPKVRACRFGDDGNLGPFIGNAYLRLRAAEQSVIELSEIPVNAALCSAAVQLATKPNSQIRSKMFYNDQMFQLINNALISTSVKDFTNNLSRQSGFFKFEKEAIIGDQGYNVNGQGNYPHYCAAADTVLVPGSAGQANAADACIAPTFNINKEGNLGNRPFVQVISDELAVKLSTYKVMSDGLAAKYTYALGAFGDQDDFDCIVGTNYSAAQDIMLEFNVDYAPLQ